MNKQFSKKDEHHFVLLWECVNHVIKHRNYIMLFNGGDRNFVQLMEHVNMKKISTTFFVVCLIALTSNILEASAQAGERVTFQVFYDNLSPYGQWIQDTEYGYVWAPSVGSDFRPYYSNGYWVMTDYGNMWVSNYPWGWATFHYGRWTYDSEYGWIWIPDSEWGPAWVSWRSNSEFYGWAPMGPGVSVSTSFESYSPPDTWWIFISPAYMYQPQWHEHYNGYADNRTIIRNTVIIRNTYNENSRTYIAGPRADDIRKVVHRDVPIYKVQDNTKPGAIVVQNNEVSVYRPAVHNSGREAPSNARKVDRPIGKPHSSESRNQTSTDPNHIMSAPSQRQTGNATTQPFQQKEIPGKEQHQSGRTPAKTDNGQNAKGNNNQTQPVKRTTDTRNAPGIAKPKTKTEENKRPQEESRQGNDSKQKPHINQHSPQNQQPQPRQDVKKSQAPAQKDLNSANPRENTHPSNSNQQKRVEQRLPDKRTDNPQQNRQPQQQQKPETKQSPKLQAQEPPPQRETKPHEHQPEAPPPPDKNNPSRR